MAVYQKALKLMYVDRLLERMKAEFVLQYDPKVSFVHPPESNQRPLRAGLHALLHVLEARVTSAVPCGKGRLMGWLAVQVYDYPAFSDSFERARAELEAAADSPNKGRPSASLAVQHRKVPLSSSPCCCWRVHGCSCKTSCDRLTAQLS